MNKKFAPGELRRRRDEWLLDLKLELIRVLRDNGKCLSFEPGRKIVWMKLESIPEVALVYSHGDILRCDILHKANGEDSVMIKPGKDKSVFDPDSKIPIPTLLEFIEQYPENPFK